jgi:ascorbate-specific PTS system EIIC-type component UlaA
MRYAKGWLPLLGILLGGWAISEIRHQSLAEGLKLAGGIWLLGFGVYVIVTGSVPVGIEDRPPSAIAKGWIARLIGILVLLLGATFLVWPEVWGG